MTGFSRFRRALPALAAAAVLAGPAAAQKTYAVPESPAFTFLEVNPAAVARPSSARAFGAAVLNGISPSGEVKQGVALDVAPWTYLPGVTVTLQEYQRSRLAFILANAQLSLATVRSAGDSADTDLALGLRLTLLDRTDPMTDTAYTNELRRRMQTRCPLPDVFPVPDDALATQRTCVGEAASAWREEWKREHGRWNATSLAVAAAGGWRFPESVAGDGAWRGLSTWATGGVPVGDFGLLLGQLRYDVPEDGGEGGGLAYGARAFAGTRVFNAFFELVGDHRGAASGDVGWTSGLEFRAAQNMWLSTGFGSRAVPGSSQERTVVIADLRWNLSDTPRLLSGR